jgi:hypothetical protein
MRSGCWVRQRFFDSLGMTELQDFDHYSTLTWSRLSAGT